MVGNHETHADRFTEGGIMIPILLLEVLIVALVIIGVAKFLTSLRVEDSKFVQPAAPEEKAPATTKESDPDVNVH